MTQDETSASKAFFGFRPLTREPKSRVSLRPPCHVSHVHEFPLNVPHGFVQAKQQFWGPKRSNMANESENKGKGQREAERKWIAVYEAQACSLAHSSDPINHLTTPWHSFCDPSEGPDPEVGNHQTFRLSARTFLLVLNIFVLYLLVLGQYWFSHQTEMWRTLERVNASLCVQCVH